MKRLFLAVFYTFFTFVFSSGAFAQERSELSAAEQLEARKQPAVSNNYRLSHKDLLRMDVFQEPDLAMEARVANDGTITLPLVGKVPVRGRTLVEAQQLITDLYNKDYLVNPQVTLLIVQYAERRVEVFGSVNRPGPVLIPPEESMTLTEAIAAAGGLSRIAKEGAITITRTLPNGRTEVFRFDFDDIIRDPKVTDPRLLDGDKIFVPESLTGG
ncbi:MAG: polysaccharide biosynthesis/export family protein [Opitutales bacterium]